MQFAVMKYILFKTQNICTRIFYLDNNFGREGVIEWRLREKVDGKINIFLGNYFFEPLLFLFKFVL